MRRGVWLVLLGVVAAALGVATARAVAAEPPAGGTTTGTTTTSTTSTTTPTTTTTSTTTTTTTPATTTTRTTTNRTPRPSAKPKHPNRPHHARKHRRQQPMRPPPDFPPAPYPLLVDGGLTRAAQENAVVSIASRYLGVPYKWGGARPKTGFDCSGLVQYVFAQLGVPLPHYAAGQWYSPYAVWIPPTRLQPGDLVFFTGPDGTRAMPGHVGIYVGDGYLIDAPHTGAFVRIDSLDARWFANKYVGAKHIVGASLGTGHVLHVNKERGFVSTVPLIHRQLSGSVFAESPPLVAAVPTATHTSAPEHYESWSAVGGVVGGVLLLLVAGAATYRRRRRRAPETAPPS
jgi:cell wall-associated NlpC family hydrolase